MSDADPENPPFGETLSSRRGFDGAWVHVRVDEVRLPTGRVTTREIVEHPGSVAIVGVTGDGNVLLLRQSHHAIGRTLLGIPAGTLEPGETPEACARRELAEETGYRAGRLSAARVVLHLAWLHGRADDDLPRRGLRAGRW